MFIVESYSLAIIFCIVTMLCWGSWANTQKLVTGKWRFELFYWDYVIGILLFSLVAAFTLGSNGDKGRGFMDDISQASLENIGSAFLGGIIFNLANILLTAAIAIAGMSVAFPVGIGIALVLGVIVNYVGVQKGDPVLLFTGVIFVSVAISLNAVAYSKKSAVAQKPGTKGIVLSVVAGVLMSFFYRFIAAAMDLNNFESPEALKMTPYTAFVVFATGILVSNFLFNTIMMKRPLEGAPLSYSEYFKGRFGLHLVGILGGAISTVLIMITVNLCTFLIVQLKLKINPFHPNQLKILAILIIFISITFIGKWFTNPFIDSFIRTIVLGSILVIGIYKFRLSEEFNQLLKSKIPFLK